MRALARHAAPRLAWRGERALRTDDFRTRTPWHAARRLARLARRAQRAAPASCCASRTSTRPAARPSRPTTCARRSPGSGSTGTARSCRARAARRTKPRSTALAAHGPRCTRARAAGARSRSRARAPPTAAGATPGAVASGRCRPDGWTRRGRGAARARARDGPRSRSCDESGLDLSQDVAAEMGDPVVRRRDGAIAYHLAVVVDDAARGHRRAIVRGRDLAQLDRHPRRRCSALPRPAHSRCTATTSCCSRSRAGSSPSCTARSAGGSWGARGSAAALCGRLACLAGLAESPRETEPARAARALRLAARAHGRLQVSVTA